MALLISAAGIRPEIVESLATTTQIAPTILSALGLDWHRLKAVKAEGTTMLTH